MSSKKNPDEKKIAALVRQLLIELGEDPDREGLEKTPLREGCPRQKQERLRREKTFQSS